MAVPLLHDSPEEIGQPKVRDWKKGQVEPIPGKTMPSLTIVTRDYPNTHKMMTALGPLLSKKPIGAKGVLWSAAEEYEELKAKLGTVKSPGLTLGMPDLDTSQQVAEAILTLAPETNGNVAVKAWGIVEKSSGLNLRHLSAARQGEKLSFRRYYHSAPQGDDFSRMERDRIGKSPLFSLCNQYRAEAAVSHPHREGAFLSGSRMDADVWGLAATIPPAFGFQSYGGHKCRNSRRQADHPQLFKPAFQMVNTFDVCG